MLDAVVAIATLGTVGMGTVLAVRQAAAARDAAGRVQFDLSFPRDFDERSAAALVAGFSGLTVSRWREAIGQPALVFEVSATAAGVAHSLQAPAGYVAVIAAQLNAVGVRYEVTSPSARTHTAAHELRRSDPLRELDVRGGGAAATGLLAALQPLHPGERVAYQWIIAPTFMGAFTEKVLEIPIFASSAPATSNREVRAWEREAAFAACLRVGIGAPTRARRRELSRGLIAALHRLRGAGPTLRVRPVPGALAASRFRRAVQPITAWPCVLRASELAIALALPINGPVLPGVRTGGCRVLAPATEIPREGRVLGESNFPGLARPLAIGPIETTRHCLVNGPTGVGKSVLLQHAILADIAAGTGVCVVDPKADLIDDLLERLPAGSDRRVIVLDPADVEHPVGFNLLRGSAASPGLTVDGLVTIMREQARGSWGPRLEDLLRNSLLTLIADPALTILEIEPLLVDPRFRARLLGRLDDPITLEPFWAMYDALSEAERGQWTAPILNKIRPLAVRPHVRRVVGQSASTFKLTEILASGGILLVPLPKGVLGADAARLLGAALIAQLWQAILGRAAMPRDARRPFSVYVDEWADFVNLPTSIGEALAQARGMNVGITLAGQHLHQVPAALREDVLTNCVTKVCFTQSATDARLFARELAPFLTPGDLQGLAAYEAVLRPAVGGGVAPPATMRTLPPGPVTSDAARTRARSRQRYGRPAAEIEAELRARRQIDTADAPIKRRRRR